VSASNEIMTASGGYSLYQSGSQSYRNLFKSENAIDAEIILARDYNNDLSLVHKVQAFENSPTLGRPGLSKKLVNYYLMKNGNRFTDQPNYATMEFKDEIVNRDPRLAQTIRTSNINMNVTMTGYHLLKYANDNMSYTGDSSNDLPLFRLAEVYLNYAEAKAELGTLTQTDIDNTINKLRTRAGVTGKLNMNAANLSPDPYMCAPETGYVNVTGDNKGVILEIRRERAIELVMEGFRYYDLMRWKEGQCMAQSFKGFYLPATAINKAYDIDGDGTNDVCFYTTSSQPNVGSVTYVKLASDGSGTSLSEGNYGNLLCYSWIDRTWNENRDYLYPVPRQEITLSDGVVTQNPGWNE
ncbi:RagB/SusD family nutrient uptake outer membrane protein, partial [Bacteroides ovatus]